MITFSKRELVAIFSGKCYMLYNLFYDPTFESSDLKLAIDSMFEQSFNILGWH